MAMWSTEYHGRKGEVRLYVYRKRSEAPRVGDSRPVLFLVHGSSASGRSSFDLQVPGRGDYSLMDHFAGLGYDVWTPDHEGYGRSDRTQSNSDVASGADDLSVAMAIVERETGQPRVRMYGGSSGALRAGLYAQRVPGADPARRVRRHRDGSGPARFLRQAAGLWRRRFRWLAIALAALPSLVAMPLFAQSYPTKPVRLIIAVPPGGPADTLSRLVSPRLTEALGQTFVMDNRPGANGNIAYEMAARAVPDGYTIVAVAAGVAINPSLYRDVKYDPLRDFAPLSLGITVPNILVVHPSVPARSVRELIDLAKARRGQLVFASAGSGTSGHLALELFQSSAGIEVVHVPYKGGGPALAELIGGQVQALFSIALAAIPQIKAGKARALAITSGRRSAVAPELPAVAEAGIPGFEVLGWFGWLVPAKTPQPIVTRLNREIVRILEEPAMHERLVGLGSDPAPSTPQQFAAFIKSEHDKWARVIKQAGIRLD